MKHIDRCDYYVYLHRRKDTNEVFYVGKGRNSRSTNKHSRSRNWNSIVTEAGGFNVEYVYKDLTSEESYIKELEQYHLFIDKVVNVKVPGNETLNYDKINWSLLIKYDENSPTFLTWLVDNGSRNPLTRRKPGDPVSCFRKVNNKLVHGQLNYKGNHYALHRITWILCKGAIPEGMVVNHIDFNPTNNNIINLELCTMGENSKRQKPRKKKEIYGVS